jgi:exodeoxyribonuclease VII large subunit
MKSALNQRTQTLQAPISVSQLTAQLKGVIDDSFGDVAVIGEISNFKPHSSGHWYFSLKDANATLLGVMFRKQNYYVRFDIQDGLKVVARGKLDIYPPKGNYQLIINSIEPVGVGSWQLAFDQLKDKLEKAGVLSRPRKSIPLMPRKIGIVTSPTAAALRDILIALRRRNPNIQVVIAPTRVQGDGAEYEIAQAIRDIQTIPDVEVVIVARGGGSIEDLWCFNTEVVAHAIATSKLPMITGIGHETDVTICDLVSDLRAPTPTAAAELVSKRRAELTERWSNMRRLLLVKMEHRVMNAHRKLEKLNPRHALARQSERIKKMQMMLDSQRDRMIRLLESRLTNSNHKLQKLESKLQAISPLRTLGRGYAIIRLPNGGVLQDAQQVKPGDQVEAWLEKGKLRLTVDEYLGDWNEREE